MPVWLRQRSKERMRTDGNSESMKEYHLVAASHKDSDSPCIGAFLDNKHLVTGCSKGDFTDYARLTKLGGCEILESRDDAALSGNCNQLEKLCVR